MTWKNILACFCTYRCVYMCASWIPESTLYCVCSTNMLNQSRVATERETVICFSCTPSCFNFTRQLIAIWMHRAFKKKRKQSALIVKAWAWSEKIILHGFPLLTNIWVSLFLLWLCPWKQLWFQLSDRFERIRADLILQGRPISVPARRNAQRHFIGQMNLCSMSSGLKFDSCIFAAF